MSADTEPLGSTESSEGEGPSVVIPPPPLSSTPIIVPTTPASGRRQAYLEIRRQLTEEDLKSQAVAKLILDELAESESECESLRGYVERYHEADKRAGVLEERLVGRDQVTRERARGRAGIDIIFGAGVGVASLLIGIVPNLWTSQPYAGILLALSIVLLLGSIVAKWLRP